MTPNFNNGAEAPTEDAVLSRIETALDSTLESFGLPLQKENHIKRQKYLYLTVENFTREEDYPITYSWFKWGVSCKGGPGSEEPGQTLYTNPATASELLEMPISEYEAFLSNVDHLPLDQWWDADLLEFLEQFYTHYRDEPYRDLYCTHIALLRILDDISIAVQYRRDPARAETYHEISEAVDDLNREIGSVNHLSQYQEYSKKTTDVIEKVVNSLVDLSGDDIEKGHDTVISELQEFYRDHFWLMVAHSISRYTAVGPNAGIIRQDSESQLDFLQSQFQKELNDNVRRCAAMELLPTVQGGEEEIVGPEEDVTQTVRSETATGLHKRQERVINAFEESKSDFK